MGKSSRMTFQCRELVYSLFRFTEAEFRQLDLEQEFGRWSQELENNSTAIPLMIGSIFDDDDGHMDLEIEEGDPPDEDAINVVAYYFYESAEYFVSSDVDSTWNVVQLPILADLCDSDGIKFAVPMAYVTSGDRDERFDCNDSSDGTEMKIAVFRGPTQVFECDLDDSADDFKHGVLDALGWVAKDERHGATSPYSTGGKNCPACQAVNDAQAKFCRNCGEKLVSAPAEVKCGACGVALVSGAKFCPECGAKTGATVAADASDDPGDNDKDQSDDLAEVMAHLKELHGVRKLDEARQLGCEALLRHRDSVELITVLATIDFGRRDYAGAVAYLRRALILDPESDVLKFRLGRLLISLGLTTNDSDILNEATARLVEIVKADPTHIQALESLGLLFRKTNEPDMARQAYERVLTLDPGNEQAKDYLTKQSS